MRGDIVQRVLDTLLLYYLIQYAVIGLLGMAGVLAPATIACGALLMSALLWTLARPRRKSSEDSSPLSTGDRLMVWGGFFFVAGAVGAIIYFYRLSAPLANDAMTYHLPAAAQWLRTGTLGVFETWFYNPANTYSPLAGSIFIVWLIAPFHSDLAARFVEVGPLLMIFWAVLSLSRRVGASVLAATLIAVAAALARPFLSHVNLTKDDLFVAAFFLAAIDALASPNPERRRWPAWRFGTALGLMLAVKYTALMSLPLLLLMADAPFRARWRLKYALVAVVIAIAIASPWYIRNIVLTHNPLFPMDVPNAEHPILRGMMSVTRSARLNGLLPAWSVMTAGYYSMPVAAMVLLLLGWLVAWRRAGTLLKDPLLRAVLLGAPLGIAIFLMTSPYAEMRFVYPSLLLLFVGCAAAVASVRRADVVVAAALLIACVATSFAAAFRDLILGFSLTGAVAAGVGVTILFATRAMPRLHQRLLAAAILCGAIAWIAFGWDDYASDYRKAPEQNWQHPQSQYRDVAGAWDFVRNQIPSDATLAYTNLYLVHPLTGFTLDRPIVYAPTAPEVRHVFDLPHLPHATTGEELPALVEHVTWEGAEAGAWIRNLRDTRAKYLIVGRRQIARPDLPANPPELFFAARLQRYFHLVYQCPAAVVFEMSVEDIDMPSTAPK